MSWGGSTGRLGCATLGECLTNSPGYIPQAFLLRFGWRPAGDRHARLPQVVQVGGLPSEQRQAHALTEDMLSICAVIAARNEAQYLRVLLPILASQAIDVAIIDNGSTDDSHEVYSAFWESPVIRIEHLAHRGFFSLTEQLERKREIYASLKHDWVIHHDADEVFESRERGGTLRDAIQEADEGKFNALNFDEFVFLPEPEAHYDRGDYYRGMLRYYFFEPVPNRKNAVWKRTAGLDNVWSGGHQLRGPRLRIFPQNHVFRHYIVLSYEHAKAKYLGRTFDAADIDRGWHGGPYGNRLNFTEDNLRIPAQSQFLLSLETYWSRSFSRARPSKWHYWLWSRAAIG